MVKSAKKKILIVVLVIIGLFVLLNGVWFIWCNVKYGGFVNNMRKTENSGFVSARYYSEDTDRFAYFVRYPDYLSLDGYLSISVPSSDGSRFYNTLVIEPNFGGGYDYRARIFEDGEVYSVAVDENGNAIHPEDADLVERNKAEIEDLFGRARRKWGELT